MSLVSFFLFALASLLAAASVLSPTLGIRILVGIVCILPLNYLLDIHFSVITFFRVYVLVGFLFLIFGALVKKNYINQISLVSMITFSVFYFTSYLLSDNIGNGVLVRDIYSLSIFFGLCFLVPNIKSYFTINSQLMNKIVIFSLAVDVIIYFIVRYYGFVPDGSRGEFFLRTGVLRYSDILTITLFGFCCILYFHNSRTQKNTGIYVMLMLLISAMSFDRVFIIWTLLISVHFFLKSKIIIKIGFIFVAFIVGAAFLPELTRILAISHEVNSRIVELFSFELLYDALYFRFVQPAVDGGYTLSFKTLLLGAGPGFLFNIPWFEYRGLAALQVSTDSYIFANFFKYGIVGVILLSTVLYSQYLKRYLKYNLWVFPYIVAHNGILVDGFLLFLLLLSLVNVQEYDKSNSCE